MKPKYCYVFRGLPGSGKTYVAERLAALIAGTVVSANTYFERYNGSVYDATKLNMAHLYCWANFLSAVKAGRAVIVDNTGSRVWEYKEYVHHATFHGYEVRIIEMVHDSFEDLVMFHERNVHGVSWRTMLRMAMRWEEDDRALLIRSSDVNVSNGR